VQVTSQQAVQSRSGNSQTVPAGTGTGVIYDASGHILTNNHVIAGADQLLVSLPDGRASKATLVGADPQTDLAVLQVTGSNLPVAKLGNSDSPKLGDAVVAIGNALGLPGSPTVSVGVVSAKDRTVQEPGDGSSPGPFLFGLIQTDAAINPGNSGGPLSDSNGAVIGINTLVATQASPGVPAQGIGFAISINTAKAIADQLVANGKVNHPYLGISYMVLTPITAAQLNVPGGHGAVVGQVAPGSPAEKAGILPGDVITAVDGKQIQGESDLAQILSMHKPGDQVKLTIVRNGASMDVTVTLGTAP
jgi:S1-C subfamily serine protease